VAEYEAAPHREKSAILRREGLFHSHVREWTGAQEAATGPATGVTGAVMPVPSARTHAANVPREIPRSAAMPFTVTPGVNSNRSTA
jgi:hypothetical protein